MMSENDLHVHGSTHSITSTQLLFSDAHYKNKRYEHFMVTSSCLYSIEQLITSWIDLHMHGSILLNSHTTTLREIINISRCLRINNLYGCTDSFQHNSSIHGHYND